MPDSICAWQTAPVRDSGLDAVREDKTRGPAQNGRAVSVFEILFSRSAQGTQLVNLKFAILVCQEPLEFMYWFTYQNVQPSGATDVLV
jgi:hypothetical protein